MSDAEKAAADAAAADATASTDSTPPADDTAAAAPTVEQLQAENAELTKAVEKRERDNFKLREERRQRDAAPDTGKEKKPSSDAGDEGQADDRATLQSALIRQAFRAEALSQGMDPDFVNVVSLEANDVVVMDDGTVNGMAEAVAGLLAEQPKLKAETAAPGTATAAPGSTTRTRGPRDVKPGEVSAMGETEFMEWAETVGVIETQDNPSAPVIRWNVSPTPNVAHGRVRSAAASRLVDRVTGGFTK